MYEREKSSSPQLPNRARSIIPRFGSVAATSDCTPVLKPQGITRNDAYSLMPNVTPSTILRPQTTQKAIVRTSRGIRRNAHYTRPSRSVLPPQPQPTVISEAGTKTLRLRQHGNQSLPLPPLMDPIAIEAKERHKKPKPGPEGQSMTDFQRELAANPHGMTTRTARVRMMSLT